MSNIAGTNLAAPIAPFTTEDTYPTHYAEYGKGGWHSVATISDRDAIPVQRRETGMVVFVQEDNTPYRLTAEGNWVNLIDLSKFSNVFDFKGVIDSIDNLPSSGNKTGDVWHITNKTAEFVWIGEKWEELGTTIDLSGYLTKSSAASTYAAASHTHDISEVNELQIVLDNKLNISEIEAISDEEICALF